MKITLDTGIVVTIPDKFEYATCKGCKAEDIIWAVTRAGKKMPIRYLIKDKVWTCHFNDCPKAGDFRHENKKNK